MAGSTEVSPREWAVPGTAAFAPWVANTFMYDAEADTQYMLQQRFVRDYLQHDGPYRGLLLYHGLGSGKTCSAIAASEALRGVDDRKVFVLLPASLRGNYVREVRKCGSDAYRESQRWRLRPASATTAGKPSAPAAVDAKLVRAHGGLWVPEAEGGRPFEELSQAERDQVRQQVDDRIARTHHFVSYNGLTAQSVRKLTGGPTNPFDGSVVVVDEVHNLVSAVSNGGLAARVYDRIMAARGCKVVLLSGTPLVNRPEELALLVNLAHGPIRVHDFVMDAPLDDHRRRQLEMCPDVLSYSEELRGVGLKGGAAAKRFVNVVSVRTVPEGFVRTSPGFVSRVQQGLDSPEGADPTRRVRDILEPRAMTAREVQLLPRDPAAFRQHFVDTAEHTVRNGRVLLQRLLGTVSFFRGHAQSLYPRLDRVLIVPAPLSARQFAEYSVQRAAELRKEDVARRMAGMRRAAGVEGDDEVLASYRPFSRAVCNFAFPEEVPRPYKGDVAPGGGADDGVVVGGPPLSDEARGLADRAYIRALDASIERLRALPQRMRLGEDGLDELSPKFAAIVRHLLGARDAGGQRARSRRADDEHLPEFVEGAADDDHLQQQQQQQTGSTAVRPRRRRRMAIVYSQFRRAEGVAILAAALDVNGFAELSVRRDAGGRLKLLVGGRPPGELGREELRKPRYMMYSNDDPEVAACLLAMYNNQLDSADIPQAVAGDLGLLFQQAPTNLRGELAQVLLITRSGAEGITTRNVREVHIVEPFWHANRIEQVIGRARRAHSHDQLPPEERAIDVFIYMATFTGEQAKRQNKRDGGKTSDQFVHEVSQRKRRVLKGLLEIMRQAAVDCRLNRGGEATKTVCYDPPAGAPPDAQVYSLDLDEDVRMSETRVQLVAVRVRGQLFYADKSTGKLYDHAALKERNEVIEVGRLGADALRALQ
jgi:hypothetical protein